VSVFCVSVYSMSGRSVQM